MAQRKLGVALSALLAWGLATSPVPGGTAAAVPAAGAAASAAPPGYKEIVHQIAPGLTLTRIVEKRVPRRTFLLTVDLTQPLALDVALAQDELPGYEQTSDIAARYGAIAAVNGDFTPPPGRPAHPFARDGELVQTRALRGTSFAIPESGIGETIGKPDQVVAAVEIDPGETWTVSRWNDGPPGIGDMVGFTPAGGTVETPPPYACSARLLASGPPTPARPDTGVIRDYTVNATACAATPMERNGGVVLSALPGTDEAIQLLSLQPGETVRIRWSFGWPDVFDAVGGDPLLVADGTVVPNTCWSVSFCARHPRTGVGITADGRILIAVVDGRQPKWSIGYSIPAFGAFFRDRGAEWAMNLDGGGSSTIVVNGEVKNRPSDDHERAVGSALMVFVGQPPAEPTPYMGPSHAAAGRAALRDPGSIGGLLDALVRGVLGPERLPRELERLAARHNLSPAKP